ncbi:hypothetical protein MMC22_007721 [Lobaria immixta]|nr:hypothetical protein [Lobaria immixta]
MSLPMLRTIERRHGMAVLVWNGDEMDVVGTPPLLLFSVQGDSEEWLSALQHLVDEKDRLKATGRCFHGEWSKRAMSLSGLPPDILAHIFTLSDIDYQGNLDRNQFGVAMHLIQRQIQGKSLPKGYSDDLIRMYNQLVQSRGGSERIGQFIHRFLKFPVNSSVDRTSSRGDGKRRWEKLVEDGEDKGEAPERPKKAMKKAPRAKTASTTAPERVVAASAARSPGELTVERAPSAAPPAPASLVPVPKELVVNMFDNLSSTETPDGATARSSRERSFGKLRRAKATESGLRMPRSVKIATAASTPRRLCMNFSKKDTDLWPSKKRASSTRLTFIASVALAARPAPVPSPPSPPPPPKAAPNAISRDALDAPPPVTPRMRAADKTNAVVAGEGFRRGFNGVNTSEGPKNSIQNLCPFKIPAICAK